MDNKPAASAPKPSSTVMVLRPADRPGGEFELFMVRRHSKSRFMPDRYVFPGGRLEEADSSPQALARLYGLELFNGRPFFRDTPGQGAYQAAVKLSREQEAGLYLAAFRELFEEAGVLLAVEETTGQPRDLQADEAIKARFANYRQALHNDRLNFIAMLEQEHLLLDISQLIYFSHWITPAAEPYRFDARFFLTVAPPNQVAESDYLETTDGLWTTPRVALDRYAAGDFNIAFPTYLHIQWLARYTDVEAACQAGRTKPVVTAMPDLVEGGNGAVITLPEDIVDRW